LGELLRRGWAGVLLLLAAAGSPAAAQSIDAIAQAAAVEDGFNGVMLLGQGRRIVATRAIGVADAARGTPMTLETRFEAGSISKWIASIIVMKLVDAGTLDIDAPIARYLPRYRQDTGARLTLRRLMSHSSGLPNDIAKARRTDPSLVAAELPQDEAVRRFASGDLAFEPGTAWDYSHSNWILVKAIVEQASGEPYARLVDRMLVRPLKLKNTGIYSGESSRVPAMAMGYARLAPQAEPKASPMPGFMAMAGGFYTSAPDMLRLMDAVLDGRVLSARSRAALMTVLVPEQHYALGGRVRDATVAGKVRTLAWEDGSNGGFKILAWRVLADGRTVIVMNNASFDQEKMRALGMRLLEASYQGRSEGRR
jgi:CubicO group peptidase (beta-lactamase class C family)